MWPWFPVVHHDCMTNLKHHMRLLSNGVFLSSENVVPGLSHGSSGTNERSSSVNATIDADKDTDAARVICKAGIEETRQKIFHFLRSTYIRLVYSWRALHVSFLGSL
jgi:hypothetical protein